MLDNGIPVQPTLVIADTTDTGPIAVPDAITITMDGATTTTDGTIDGTIGGMVTK